METYSNEEIDTGILKKKVIGIIGYGNQGSAQAKCLRDAGFNVVVGAREKGDSWKIAEDDRFTVLPPEEVAAKADIVMLLTPDMAQKQVYDEHIKGNLKDGNTLYFSHGFNITFGLIQPPPGVDVVMLAPKATGSRLREAFLHEEGVPALLAVHQDASGKALETALALAKAMLFTKKAVFQCTFNQETYANLFAEQAITVGGVASLMQAGFDTMTKNGIPPEVAYFECVEVFKLITDMIEKKGLKNMLYGISSTASYGGATRGKKVITKRTRENMQKVFDSISSGEFTREWLQEHDSGMKEFKKALEKESSHELEKTGERLRPLLAPEED